MEKLITSDEQLRKYIPNVLDTVEGEVPLFDKLSPFLVQQQMWLESEILGSDDLPVGSWLPVARRLIALRAFADAIPSLDIVLSPNGFAVVSTSEMAPASKERVERLVASIRSTSDECLCLLVDNLKVFRPWLETQNGIFFTGSLIRSLQDVKRWHRSDDLLATYDKVYGLARQFEVESANSYLGSALVHQMISFAHNPNMNDDLGLECAVLLPLLRNAENRWIDVHVRDQKHKCPDTHELWHLLSPVIDCIKRLPRIFREIWGPEMGEALEPFNNNIPGAYFF